MLEVFIDPAQRLVWTTFSGTLTRADFAAMDETGRILIEEAKPLIAVLDFSGIDDLEITREDILRRAVQPPVPGLRRIVMAPREDSFSLAHLFVAAQSLTALDPPVVVRSRGEMRGLIELDALQLRKLDRSKLREELREMLKGAKN